MEEFTFPIITTSNNALRLAVLPPLWRISSISNQPDEFEFHENGRKRHVCRSFSEVEDQIMQKDAYGRTAARNDETTQTEEAEEKMDMLWEDFNEELQGNANSYIESSGSDSEPRYYYHHKYNSKNLEEGFETAEEYSINTVHQETTMPKKKKNLELVLKMMKKLVFLQNKARIKKRGHKY
ncbi:hypothetical protein Salat_2570800 [Sesamum alatum]|uniref:Uncharacterized protein n=1 Tax=Sesamum alatum TaxID=300844 RepID=A0AAE2CCW2_9LAMI|nr:hypothetical protein Salat_2570800 [Sesamum alatum]